MKGGLGNLMKQAQAMQATMQKAQEEIAAMEVTATSSYPISPYGFSVASSCSGTPLSSTT